MMIKRKVPICFLPIIALLLVGLLGCSLQNKLPSDGVWYNEELDVSIEFKTEPNSEFTDITNILWHSKQEALHAHIGYGSEIYFYIVDGNGDEINLLEGHFRYSNDEFIIIASKIADPFDIHGTMKDANDKEYIFTRI